MKSNIECWIGKKFIGDLREIAILDFTPYVEQGYLATEKEVKEIAQKKGWKVKKTAAYNHK